MDNSSFFRGLNFENENVEIKKDIARNPILIPIIFEGDKENVRAKHIWKNITEHLGSDIYDYYGGRRMDFPSDMESGGRYVQKMFMSIYERSNLFYDRIQIYYRPLYELDNIQIIHISITYQPEELERTLEIVKKISERSLFTTFYMASSIDESRSIRISIHSGFDQFFGLMKWMNANDIDYDYLIMDKARSWDLWNESISKFSYWELFDVKNMEWVFDSDRYKRNVDDLVPLLNP